MVNDIASRISSSRLSIYDSLQHRSDLFIPTEQLEGILNKKLHGLSLNYPIRTRSKVLKSAVCEALGYPVPTSFAKTRPRFPGQNFDTYVQKSNNLQIWNEEVSLTRRYVLIRVDDQDIIKKVRVVTGENLAAYDTTGTLTQKYQAKSRVEIDSSAQLSREDTPTVQQAVSKKGSVIAAGLLTIRELYSRLIGIVGMTIDNPGVDQERNRGGVLHRTVCLTLDCQIADCGQFPDVREQLLEVKLQTSPTIDLGLVSPDSADPIASIPEFSHRDVRYAVFYGTLVSSGVRIRHLVLVTGTEFFKYFQRFEGKITNKKLQIPLPAMLFQEPE